MKKNYDRKTFNVLEGVEIVCDSTDTRYGFKHEAEIFINDKFAGAAKCCYYNRTWESFEYQSVCQSVVEKCKGLSKDQKKQAQKFLKEYQEGSSAFAAIGMIAAIGDLLCDTQQEKNDWKKRMLKAGMGEGLSFPDNWDSLSEDEKQKRLDGAIAIANE